MSFQLGSLKSHPLENINPVFPKAPESEGEDIEKQEITVTLPTEGPVPISNKNENHPSLPCDLKHMRLEERQMDVLKIALEKPRHVLGKNGMVLELIPQALLKDLQGHLQINLRHDESISLALIGSAVGHAMSLGETDYNDLDFLIQIQIPINEKQLNNKSFIEKLVKKMVKDHFLKTSFDIEKCLATALNLPNSEEELLREIGNNYFDNPCFYNFPINLDDLENPTNNRCSIIKFGQIEFKTAIDVRIHDDSGKTMTIIPGLIKPSAFSRDDIRIYFTPEYFQGCEGPLEARSLDVPIKDAMHTLDTRELRTSRADGSKCLKGIENITFKGCYYPEEKTNMTILNCFLEMTAPFEKLEKHFEKYKKKYLPYPILCELSNFCINASNMEIDLKRAQPLSSLLDNLFPQIPNELLLKWCPLSLFLSGKPVSYTSDVLSLSLNHQAYYLLNPKYPVKLLQDFLELLRKHPEIPLEKLPILGMKFETVKQLCSEVKSRLTEEELITLNHCCLSSLPSLLDGEENLELEMLTTLLRALPNIKSAKTKHELTLQTKTFFDRKKIDAATLFAHLEQYAKSSDATLSQIFLSSIQSLVLSHPKIALHLWYYADKEMVFANSAALELEAVVCLQQIEKISHPSKKELVSLLNNMMFRLSYVSKKLTSENNTQPKSFNDQLLSLVDSYSKEDFNLKDLKFIHGLLADIEPLPTGLKDKIADKFLDAFIRLAPKIITENEREILLETIKRILQTCSKEVAENHLSKAVCYLKTYPNYPALPCDFLVTADPSKIEIFRSILIQEMKKETLASSVFWFTLLNQGKLLEPCEEKSLECCRILLWKWDQKRDLKQLPQMLPAIEILKTTLEKEIDAELYDLTFKSYSTFVQNCLNSKDPILLQAAENILRQGIKTANPSVQAQCSALFSNLICAYAKTGSAESLLLCALEQKILGADTPAALTKAFLAVLEGPLSTNFIETALQNPSLIQALQTEENANEAILLLIHNSHQMESAAAIKNLASLFKQLHENMRLKGSKDGKNPEIEMLNLLLKALPNLTSPELRLALIQQTQLIFAEKSLNAAQLFDHLISRVKSRLQVGSIFLTAIQDLSTSLPNMANGLWLCAERESLFTGSPIDELNALACIQKIKLSGHPTKKQLVALLTTAADRLTHLSKKLTLEDSKELSSFHSQLLYLVDKVSEGNLTLEELTSVQKLLQSIASFECIPTNLKREMTETIICAFTKLKFTFTGGKNEQSDIIGFFKGALEICSEKTAGKIVHHLKTCPNSVSIASHFLKTPFFISALMEEMKQGTLEDNIEWFTLLYREKLLLNDQKSWECCGSLLEKWEKKPDVQLLKQLLPAFQHLKNFLDKATEKKEDAVLKSKALTYSVNFLKSCINSKEKELIQKAENLLLDRIKHIPPLEEAELFTDLICTYGRTKQARDLLNYSLKQKILSEQTPAHLIKAYLSALDLPMPPQVYIFSKERTIAPKSNLASPFVESALENAALIKLLENPETENASSLIHLLIDNATQVKSVKNVKTLIALLKQLYENKTAGKTDISDKMIVESTVAMCNHIDTLGTLDYRSWFALVDILNKDSFIFKDSQMDKKALLGCALKRGFIQPLDFIDKNYAKPEHKDTCLKLLKILDKYENLSLFDDAYLDLQKDHFTRTLVLKGGGEILKKLSRMDSGLQYESILQTLVIFIRFQKEKYCVSEEEMEQLLEMLDEYCKSHSSKELLKFTYLECGLEVLLRKCTADSDSLILVRIFTILQRLYKSHPEKFDDILSLSTIVVGNLMLLPHQFIVENYMNENKRDACLRQLDLYSQFDTLPLRMDDFMRYQQTLIEFTVMLGRTDELLPKIALMNPGRKFGALMQTTLSFLKSQGTVFEATIQHMNKVFEMLDLYREPHEYEKGLKFTFFEPEIFRIFDECTEEHDAPVSRRSLAVLQKLIASHPDKFENIEATCTHAIQTALKFKYFAQAEALLEFAKNVNYIKDLKFIEEAQKKIESGRLDNLFSNKCENTFNLFYTAFQTDLLSKTLDSKL